MNDEGCVITVNGTDYYYPCDRRDDIILVNNRLVNTGSSTITLYGSWRESGVSNSGYPRISMASNTYATYQASYNSQSSTLAVNSIEFKTTHYSLSVYLLVVLIGVVVIQLFKRS